MARYTVTETSYVNEALRAPGDLIDVPDDTVPGPHWVPYVDPRSGQEDAAARSALDRANKERRGPRPGDPEYIGALIAHSVGDGATGGRVSAASAHAPVAGSPGVVLGGDGHPIGVVAGVAEPVQAPYARLPGATQDELQQAVKDDAAALEGKGPIAEEAAASNKRRRGE